MAGRTIQDIELPPLPPREASQNGSRCLQHKGMCAYTGREKDRCKICHSTFIDGVCSHMELPPGRTRPCFCNGCGELFSSVSSFDTHQRPAGRCRDPERRGLVLVDKNGWMMWASPGSPDFSND
jgi:hypothetical protein